MRAERVVLDTNVLISAFLSAGGKPAASLDWTLTYAKLLTAAELLDELETRLERPRLAKYSTESHRKEFVAQIRQVAVLVPVVGTIKVCRDPDDDVVLEVAVSGQTDCIVTGDKDLLMLDPFQEIPILSPADFIATAAINNRTN